MTISNISDTARWVAVYRAMESERPDALFQDPYARRLAGERGEEIVRSLPGGRRIAAPMIVRTHVLDQIILNAIERDGADAVLNLAAGLDARPYRLPLTPRLRWIEVDLPAMVEYKRAQLAGERPRCTLESHAVDLADGDARRALFARVAAECARVLVVCEGLLIYLEAEQVGSLARDLAAQSSFHWWTFDLTSPALLAIMKRQLGKAVAAGNAPFKFAPPEGPDFFRPFGWRVRETYTYWDEAKRLHRDMPGFWLYRLIARFASEERRRVARDMTRFVLLERDARPAD